MVASSQDGQRAHHHLVVVGNHLNIIIVGVSAWTIHRNGARLCNKRRKKKDGTSRTRLPASCSLVFLKLNKTNGNKSKEIWSVTQQQVLKALCSPPKVVQLYLQAIGQWWWSDFCWAKTKCWKLSFYLLFAGQLFVHGMSNSRWWKLFTYAKKVELERRIINICFSFFFCGISDLRCVAQGPACLQAAPAWGEAVGGADGGQGRRGHNGSSGPIQGPVNWAVERRLDAAFDFIRRQLYGLRWNSGRFHGQRIQQHPRDSGRFRSGLERRRCRDICRPLGDVGDGQQSV